MTTTTAPAACTSPPRDDHEHCPLHGCVEYVCCLPVVTAPTTTTIEPAQSWMAAFSALWPAATDEDMQAAREYIPLMALPEEAALDLGGPVAKCDGCRLVVGHDDLTYHHGADVYLCASCSQADL